jgi:hypothetical protein
VGSFVVTAGSTVWQFFAVSNNGNVALRGVDTVPGGDLEIACNPPLGSTLPVGQTLYCQGRRFVTQDDVEANYVTWTQRIVTSNIITQPPGLLTRVVKLPTVTIQRYADLLLELSNQTCRHQEWSRKCFCGLQQNHSVAYQGADCTVTNAGQPHSSASTGQA